MRSKRFSLLFAGILLLFLVGNAGAVPTGLDINFPVEGNNYNNNVTTINWSFSGALNSTTDKCWYELNSVSWTEFSCSDNILTVPTSIEGNNTWKIKINDTLSDVTKTTNFWVDGIAPVLAVLDPLGNIGYTNTNSLNLIVNLLENNKGGYAGDVSGSPDNSNRYIWRIFEYPLGGGTWNSYTLNASNISDVSTTLTNPGDQQEGNYTYNIKARDKYPGGSTIREVQTSGVIIRDITPPSSVNIKNPADNSNNTGSFSIDTNASDSLSGVASMNVSIINSSGIIIDDLSCASYSGSCDTIWDSTAFADGTYIINATAYDKAGNSNSTSITINIDNTAPEVYFNSPASGIYNTSQIINISAFDVNLGILELRDYSSPNFTIINSTLASSSYGEIIHTLISEGNYTLFGNAGDTFGNTNQTEVRNIIIDLTAPNINAGADVMTNSQITKNAITYDALSGINSSSYSWTPEAWPFGGNITFSNANTEDTNISADLEGTYTIRLTVADNAGNSNYSEFNLTWDTTAPIIALNGLDPLTIEAKNQSYVEAGANYSDALSGINNSSEVIDNSSVNVNVIGTYYVSYYIKDNAGNNATVNRTVYVNDTTIPVITLNSANPQTIELGVAYSELGATASDNYDGDISSNITIDSSSVNTSAVGSYNVTYDVNDSSNNPAAQVIRTVYVNDTASPIVSLLNPNNNIPFAFGTSPVALEFNYSDPSNVSSCSLYLNSALNITQANKNNFSVIGLSSGLYSWSVSCNDSQNNIGNSETRYLTILENLIEISEFSNYTNLSAEGDISNVSYFFVQNEFGMVNFTEAINFSSGTDWTKYINISFNRIDIDAATFSELDKSAVIELYNLTFSDPRILKDGAVCSDCVETSYIGGTFIFSVSGSGIYSAEETPNSPPPSNGGGGGGSSIQYYKCGEWGEWSVCNSGQQTRACLNRIYSNAFEGVRLSNFSDIETKDCATPSESLNSEEKTEDKISDNENTQEEEVSAGAGITGGIIGFVKTPYGIFSIIFVVVISAAAATIIFRRKYLKDMKDLRFYKKPFNERIKISPPY